jgi:redox-sensitive bicupin YhaK (pirin superfamily)
MSESTAIAQTLDAHARDLGGFSVRRVLPSMARRLVGPFAFFDHMGPVTFAPGDGIDVRPHPHIGLATVTYLFEGEIVHRDTLGSVQAIRPGDINWMVAGRGIAHSERTAPERRASGARLHGLQLWVALPTSHEEDAPSFHHHPASTIPTLDVDGATVRVLAGSAYGATSPVETCSPLFYVDAKLASGRRLDVPTEHAQRAMYVVEGRVACDGVVAESGRMLVFARDAKASIEASRDARVVFVGGAPLDGERHIWWNFVSSSLARIETAKADWKAGRFGVVPGDEVEFIPLPER